MLAWKGTAGGARTKRVCPHSLKPREESENQGTDILEDVELPEYVPDPLFNATPIDEEEDIRQMDPTRRRTKIIVDLVNAGGYFDDKLEEYREYLDVDLLKAFYGRIEMAEEYEDKSTSEGLRMIWRRVRAEVERKNASPAMRLLDRLLALLHPSSGGTSKERYLSALGLLYEAFTQSQTDTVDIFGLAESLAEGEPPPSGLFQELVPKGDFIRELEELLLDAEASEPELKEKKETLLRQKEEAPVDDKQYRVLSKQLTELEQFMKDRQQSLKDVKTVLDMAKAG